MSINQVSISGNITRDSELKTEKVLKFTVAVNERRKVGEEWKDVPSFIDCVLFGTRASSLQAYLRKGDKVALTGSLRQEKWEKDGEARSSIQVVVDEVDLMYRPRTEDKPQGVYDQDVPF